MIEDKLSKHRAIVHSSHGDIEITIPSGIVVDIVRGRQLPQGLPRIIRFNLEEWRRYYNAKTYETEYDILDLGYWTSHDYIPPDKGFRERIKRNGKT